MAIIGIVCDYDWDNSNHVVRDGYVEAVRDCGGIPLLLPVYNNDNDMAEEINKIINLTDGLILPGGSDIAPLIMGEEPHIALGRINPERDIWEMALCRAFLKNDKPILGVCKGIQLLNVVAGGTLWQDVNSADKLNPIQHSQSAPLWYGSHSITIDKDSEFALIFGEKTNVNSTHHQAIKDIAPGFAPWAWSEDGIIEGIKKIDGNYAVGVQWHPEKMFKRDKKMMLLFKSFVDAARENKNGD